MAKKELYQLMCEDGNMYLKLTKAQAKLVEEVVDFIGACGEVGFEKFEMPTKFFEIDEED